MQDMKLASKSAGRFALPLVIALGAGLSACDDNNTSFDQALRDKVKNVVVIYGENRSFDSLFGKLPGVNGLSQVVDSSGNPTSAYVKQVDRDGTVLPKLPQTWGGVTAAGNAQTITQAQS